MALGYGELVKTIWSKSIASLFARACPTSKTPLNLVFKTLYPILSLPFETLFLVMAVGWGMYQFMFNN